MKNLKKPQHFQVLLSGFFVLSLILVLSVQERTNASVVSMHAQFAADYSDDRILMGASHNVFVGKVVKQIGNKDRGSGPETQYEVEIVENIKGDLQGVITVNQAGGYKDGVLYVMDDGSDHGSESKKESNLLHPGSTYLLATRYSNKYGWYTVNSHVNASKLITTDASKEKNELADLAVQDEKLQKLKIAYENEILIEADIKSNNTRNSYTSVQERKVSEDHKVKEDSGTHSEIISDKTTVEDSSIE